MKLKIDFPKANEKYPLEWYKSTIFLKNHITRKNIEVGDYTYFDDLNGNPQDFETKNVFYHYESLGDKLKIGKFCQIASNVKFLMNGMFHNQKNFTAFPFTIFSKELAERYGTKEKAIQKQLDEIERMVEILQNHGIKENIDSSKNQTIKNSTN